MNSWNRARGTYVLLTTELEAHNYALLITEQEAHKYVLLTTEQEAHMYSCQQNSRQSNANGRST